MHDAITLRKPHSNDGYSVFKLIKNSPPLDTNSAYCNLLQCSHFASTSVIAISNEKTVGFISAYIKPEQADTLFVWQVAVCDSARGQGLAKKMLSHIVERDSCDLVSHLETTITEDNKASWALFESFTQQYQTELVRSVMFDKEQHFGGEHATELLARIGPFKRAKDQRKSA